MQVKLLCRGIIDRRKEIVDGNRRQIYIKGSKEKKDTNNEEEEEEERFNHWIG